MSVSITLSEDIELFLQTQASKLGIPLETLISRTIEERWSAASRVSSVPAYESELLFKIQNAFSPEETLEYQMLCRRSDEGTITENERKRLLDLIEKRDFQNADRLVAVGEIARLRGLSMHEAMVQLNIHPE
jgi:antitoxin component of RelBE/YafQ-DinJ toxin-antitoxin module